MDRIHVTVPFHRNLVWETAHTLELKLSVQPDQNALFQELFKFSVGAIVVLLHFA